jgi:hypothetical protein
MASNKKPLDDIMHGVDDIIDRQLGCQKILSARYETIGACKLLSARHPPNFHASDLIRAIACTIKSNWLPSERYIDKIEPSLENWRFVAKPCINKGNPSDEKKLEKAIAKGLRPDWANQIPTASGLTSATRGKSRNIDLVHRLSTYEYEFIELKIGSNTPLMATMELLQYFVLFLLALQEYPRPYNDRWVLLNARRLHLQVLAPQAFYRPYDLQWLEQELGRGFSESACPFGVWVDFAFRTFGDDFVLPYPEGFLADTIALKKTLETWSAPRWRKASA